MIFKIVVVRDFFLSRGNRQSWVKLVKMIEEVDFDGHLGTDSYSDNRKMVQ